MTHSIIPPSSAAIWGAPDGCPGWVLMNQLYPETEQSEAAAEGEAAHEIGAITIEDAKIGIRPNWANWKMTGSARNGVPFTEEMFEAAEVYANDVAKEMRTRGVFTPRVEERLAIPHIHEQSSGTPDCWLWDRQKFELLIWDFKFGFDMVEAFENWQLINYTAGIPDQLYLPAPGLADQEITVRMRVVQPRAFHRNGPVREWAVKASALRGYFNILAANAAKALGPDPGFKTGAHCKHCPGRHACPAALQAGTQLFEAATAAVPIQLEPAALGLQLRLIERARKQLEYLETGYHEQVKLLAKAGTDVPGWAVEPKCGRERWTLPAGDVLRLGEMFGVNLAKPAEPVTPKQARKLGIDGDVIKPYCETPSTGIKIVPDDGNKAKQVFS